MELTAKEKLPDDDLIKRKELGCSRQWSWAKKNKEKAAASRKAWNAANKEKIAEYQRKKREKNKAKIPEKPKHDSVAAAIKRKAYMTEYRHKHPEKWRAAAKKWVEDNKEKFLNSPYYIAKVLCIPVSSCPTELIEIKREKLCIDRLVKQLNVVIKEASHGTQ